MTGAPMNDVISVQLAISKLHMDSLLQQQPSAHVATEALAELNTSLAELEAINAELQQQNEQLQRVTQARDNELDKYRQLFEQVPVAYLVTDRWGVMEEVNSAASELLGVRTDLLVGKPISVFVPPAERRAFRDRLNQIESRHSWEVIFQPRGRDRIELQLDITVIPTTPGLDPRLGWVLHNLTPQSAAASAVKMLERETALRLEAQATSLRLRALHIGLETMAHDEDQPLRNRIASLLDALVPRFGHQLLCFLPGESDDPIVAGKSAAGEQVLQTVILGPKHGEGRLIAKRATAFAAEDGAILQSASNGISLLLYARYGLMLGS
jgi:PAS domain S-box-containing protein